MLLLYKIVNKFKCCNFCPNIHVSARRHTDVVRELTEQVSSTNEASESLRKELETLKESSSKNVLIAAKQKIMKISAENAAFREQVAELQARVTTVEQNKGELHCCFHVGGGNIHVNLKEIIEAI